MTDLQACYDKQLSKIVSIVQYSVGIETKPIQLTTKTLSIMRIMSVQRLMLAKTFTSEEDQH